MADCYKSILIVEDDELFREAIQDTLEQKYTLQMAESAEEALTVLSESSYDLVIVDINLPGKNGIELLAGIKTRWSMLPVIMITAYDSIPQVVDSIKKGASDYLVKPINAQELLLSLERALESYELQIELEHRRKLQSFSDKSIIIIGSSQDTKKLKTEAARVAKTDATILLEGETGTGKELIAQLIHADSPRSQRPCVVLNCGAIPENLVESEIFGHVKGAFTGAFQDSMGKFELAHRGTLILDEIGELPMGAQVKLLRILEEEEFYRVGGSRLIKVDVRVIASTNGNLKELAQEGKFRQDLLFRLNVYRIVISPLRHRQEDIIELAEFFIEKFARKSGRDVPTLTSAAQELLLNHNWHGNVRELRNVVERVVLFSKEKTIEKEHLGFIESTAPSRFSAEAVQLPSSGIDLEEVEKSLLLQALKLAKYNKSKAAKLLHLTPPTFYYRLEKYDLK